MCINLLTFFNLTFFFARIQLKGSLRKGREWSIEKADTENAIFDAKMYFRIENCIFGADLSQIRGRRRAHAGAPRLERGRGQRSRTCRRSSPSSSRWTLHHLLEKIGKIISECSQTSKRYGFVLKELHLLKE